MRDGHWRWTTARVRSCRAAQGRAPGPDQHAEVLARGGDLDRVLVEEAGLDRPVHAELAQEAGQERPPDLTLLFERHSLGHVHCLLRFRAPLRSPFGGRPCRGAVPRAFHRRHAGGRRLAAIAPAASRTAGPRTGPGPRPVPRPGPGGLAYRSRWTPPRPPARDLTVLLGSPGVLLRACTLAALLAPSLARPAPRRARSRRGRAPTGRTRARTRASTRMRPKSPVLGSPTTITSASPTATPSWSRACSVASSTVFPATSTHSTRYRAFLVRFERDRGCAFGAGRPRRVARGLPVRRPPSRRRLPPVGGALAVAPAEPVLAGGGVALAAAVPSVAVESS